MSDEYSVIRVQRDAEFATITLDRPDAMNAITATMLTELHAALDSLSEDHQIRVVILTGAGRAFSAGVDLKALGDRSLENGKVGDFLDLPARAVIDRIASMEAVVIAKVNGFCFTGALELALACDLLITADEAKLGDTHAKWGLRPTWGMSQRLPLRVGSQRAHLLSYTAATFTGVQAALWGLAAASFPADSLDDEVARIVASLLENSGGSLRAYKDLFAVTQDLPLSQGLAYEADTDYPIDDTEVRIAQFRS
jgi:enoyl-CoA hydratase